jgi:hypothetical protein
VGKEKQERGDICKTAVDFADTLLNLIRGL